MDDEFLEYCELNKIEDIEKLAREVFNRGFAILKYGNIPFGVEIKNSPSLAVKKVISTMPTEKSVVIDKKMEKNDLYSE